MALNMNIYNEEKLEMLRQFLQKKLMCNLKDLKKGVQKKTVCRKIKIGKSENTKLIIDLPAWIIPVLYDDLSLLQMITEQNMYLPRQKRITSLIYKKVDSDYDKCIYRELHDEVLWYFASQNHYVTDEVLIGKLEEYCVSANESQKKALQGNLFAISECYLYPLQVHEKMYAEERNRRVKVFWQKAPHLTEKLLDYLVRHGFPFAYGLTGLLLWEEEILDEIANNKVIKSFEWYSAFCEDGVWTYGKQPNCFFSENEEMIRSFQYYVNIVWKLRKSLGTRFLELLLKQWENMTNIWIEKKENAKRHSKEGLLPVALQEDSMLTDKNWKYMDNVLQKQILMFCKEHPESISDMVQRRTFFPSARSLRLLSCKVLHSAVPVTIKYLEKRNWNWNAPFLYPFAENRIVELQMQKEDVDIFHWIRVSKKRKTMTRLEHLLLQYASDDVILAAGRAGVFSLDNMDAYMDYSRRFGRMELIPLLIKMEE